MPDPWETEVLVALCETLSSNTRLARRLALIEPTRKLAQLLAGSRASSSETSLSSIRQLPGLSPHCSREISGAQVTHKGDSRHVVSLSA